MEQSNFNMFHIVACLCELNAQVKDEIAGHFSTQNNEFKSYFPERDQNGLSIARNPFRVSIERVDELQDELIHLNDDPACLD